MLLLLFLLLFKLLKQLSIGLGILHIGVHCQCLIIGFDSPIKIPGMGQSIAAIVVAVGTVEIEIVTDCRLVVACFVGGAATPLGIFKQALCRCRIAAIHCFAGLLVCGLPQILPAKG